MKRYEDHDWQASMKLRVDYNNMLCSHVGQYGIDPSALQAREAQYAAAARAMQEKRDTGMKWRNLPHNQGQIVKDLRPPMCGKISIPLWCWASAAAP